MSVSVALAQITWNGIPYAPNTGALAFDSWRQRLVSIGNGSTYEFDGTAWTQVPGAGSPYAIGWIAFDPVLGTVIGAFHPGPPPTVNVWRWDGVSWTISAPQPTFLFDLTHATYLWPLGLVFTYWDPLIQGLALYSWNGGLTLLPTGAQLPPTRPQFGNNYYVYHSMTSDRTTGKLVLFGRTELDPQYMTVANEAITWEWDPVNGWVNLGANGTLAGGATIWFDEHRGKVMRLDTYVGGHSAFMRTATGGWTPFPLQAPSVPLSLAVGYDPLHNRFYGVGGSGAPGYYADVHPATYEWHRASCSTIPCCSPIECRLTQPSSRAWLGGTLSVDIGYTFGGALPTPFAFLAMGFGDQTFGGSPLPISLASIGMPSCTLNIDAQALLAANVSGGVGTLTLPIPTSLNLVGLEFFQQAFAVVPGANPLNMLASESMRGRVGRSQ